MKFFLATCLILILVTLLSDFRVFTVVSGSMEPTIRNGSFVIVKKSQTYKTGDLITFKNTDGTETVTHRIVKIENLQGTYAISTKGDHNAEIDPDKISPESIIGKSVFVLPFAGKIMTSITSQKLLPITFYIPMGLLFGNLVRKLKLTV
jgi:signal peptidase